MHFFGNELWSWGMPFGISPWFGGSFFALLILWSLAWKGAALWRAAREGSKGWFAAILITNTLGVLEILYLYAFSRKAEPVAKENSK